MGTETTCVVIASSTALGQEMMNRCLEMGHSVIGIPKNDGVDFGHVNAVREALEEVKPNIVFNAFAASDSCRRGAAGEDTVSIAAATANIASASKRLNAFMVHLSSSQVFEPDRKYAYDVDDAPNGTSATARELIDAERTVQQNDRSAIVRTGHGLSLDIGDIVRQLCGGFRVTVPASHSVQPACCRNTSAVALQVGVHGRSCIVHAANGGDCGWYQFVSAIRDDLGTDCQVVPTFVHDDLAEKVFPDYPVLNLQSMVQFGGHAAHWRDAVRRCLRLMYVDNVSCAGAA